MRLLPLPQSEFDCGTNLSYLHIMNIRVSTLGWAALSKGLEVHSCALTKLTVNLVEFDRESLGTLADGIKKNSSIQVLDLSYNNLKDSYGDIFARIISSQT